MWKAWQLDHIWTWMEMKHQHLEKHGLRYVLIGLRSSTTKHGTMVGFDRDIIAIPSNCDSKKVDFHQSKPTCEFDSNHPITHWNRRRPHVWPCAFGGNDGKWLVWTKPKHSRSNVGIHTHTEACMNIHYIYMHIHARIYLYIWNMMNL